MTITHSPPSLEAAVPSLGLEHTDRRACPEVYAGDRYGGAVRAIKATR
jgi:hypothetical protein